MINMMVALKIAEYFPDRTAVMCIYDDQLQKYSAAVVAYDRSKVEVHHTLYSMERYIYDTDEDAIKALTKEVDYAMATVRIMSN